MTLSDYITDNSEEIKKDSYLVYIDQHPELNYEFISFALYRDVDDYIRIYQNILSCDVYNPEVPFWNMIEINPDKFLRLNREEFVAKRKECLWNSVRNNKDESFTSFINEFQNIKGKYNSEYRKLIALSITDEDWYYTYVDRNLRLHGDSAVGRQEFIEPDETTEEIDKILSEHKEEIIDRLNNMESDIIVTEIAL